METRAGSLFIMSRTPDWEVEVAAEEEPVRIVLTPEQREVVRRMSGQNIDAIELTPDKATPGGGPLRFLWRLSAATGIPRHGWFKAETPPPPK
jgi:hypothetical protein